MYNRPAGSLLTHVQILLASLFVSGGFVHEMIRQTREYSDERIVSKTCLSLLSDACMPLHTVL